MQKRKNAFTLIELIVVIAILAILAVALIPLINNFIEKSRISRIMTTISSLETAAVAYNADVASFPDDRNDFFADSELVVNKNNLSSWDGPYLNRNTEGVSPWGTDLRLTRINSRLGELLEDEYSLFLEDPNGNTIPNASLEEIDRKIDGSVGGTSDGKFQHREGAPAAVAVIVIDAYPEEEQN